MQIMPKSEWIWKRNLKSYNLQMPFQVSYEQRRQEREEYQIETEKMEE